MASPAPPQLLPIALLDSKVEGGAHLKNFPQRLGLKFFFLSCTQGKINSSRAATVREGKRERSRRGRGEGFGGRCSFWLSADRLISQSFQLHLHRARFFFFYVQLCTVRSTCFIYFTDKHFPWLEDLWEDCQHYGRAMTHSALLNISLFCGFVNSFFKIRSWDSVTRLFCLGVGFREAK